MDALDSVDGLGVTIGDLTPEGKLKVIFAQLRKNELSDEFVRALEAKAKTVKAGADAAQDEFDKIGRTPVAKAATKGNTTITANAVPTTRRKP